MASPFPGVDPYIEAYGQWTDFHQSFLTYLRDALQPLVRPRYLARLGTRVFLASPFDRGVYPDVSILRTKDRTPRVGSGTVVAEIDADDEPIVLSLESAQIEESYVEIVDPESGWAVVTSIELLSPANKTPGSPGRELYAKKQAEVLASRASLVEIDLLFQGEHTVAPPAWKIPPVEPRRLLATVVRGPRHDTAIVRRIGPRRRLPIVDVPLGPRDADVPCDLQALYARAYENGAYEALLDYRRPVPRFLDEEDRGWAEELLAPRRA